MRASVLCDCVLKCAQSDVCICTYANIHVAAARQFEGHPAQIAHTKHTRNHNAHTFGGTHSIWIARTHLNIHTIHTHTGISLSRLYFRTTQIAVYREHDSRWCRFNLISVSTIAAFQPCLDGPTRAGRQRPASPFRWTRWSRRRRTQIGRWPLVRPAPSANGAPPVSHRSARPATVTTISWLTANETVPN